MCRAYGTASRAYIRACYRTGQPGLKVPTDQAVWGDNGHLDLSGLAVTPGTKPDGVMQHYRVPRSGLAEVIADVERRYQPRSVLFTELGGQLYASLHLPRALPAISERMATFGWVAEPARDGLPLPPERAVTRRPRRGRVEHYALVVVFDTETGAETLAALAEIAGDDPARRFVSANAKTRRTIAYGWKDDGWTRHEWERLWERIAELGGGRTRRATIRREWRHSGGCEAVCSGCRSSAGSNLSCAGHGSSAC